jgi:hypothetical protein
MFFYKTAQTAIDTTSFLSESVLPSLPCLSRQWSAWRIFEQVINRFNQQRLGGHIDQGQTAATVCVQRDQGKRSLSFPGACHRIKAGGTGRTLIKRLAGAVGAHHPAAHRGLYLAHSSARLGRLASYILLLRTYLHHLPYCQQKAIRITPARWQSQWYNFVCPRRFPCGRILGRFVLL